MSLEELQIYNDLLVKWQKAINLVSQSTIQDAWKRHFEDSLQLVELVPAHVKAVADLGSGGGFPGLVLAIARPDLDVNLVESDERKCQFLRTVSRETNAPVGVHNGRVEDVLEGLGPDLITARAFAPLARLIEYARPSWSVNPGLEMLLLKGRLAQEEVGEARQFFDFDVQFFPSKTDSDAHILHITKISEKDSG